MRLVDAVCVVGAVTLAALLPEWIEAEARSGDGIGLTTLVDHGLPALVVAVLAGYIATVVVAADTFFNSHRFDR